MRTTIVSTAAALTLLLAGCGGGDDDSDSAAPGPESSASPDASSDASSDPQSEATSGATTSTSGPKSSSKPGKSTGSPAPAASAEPYAPPIDPLLPEPTEPYPSAQLAAAFSGETVMYCGALFPLDRVLHPIPANKLSPAVRKAFKGISSTTAKDSVLMASEDHVVVADEFDLGESTNLDWWEVHYNTNKKGVGSWSYYDDVEPQSCQLHRVLPDLETPGWYLGAAPKPGDRSIKVAVFLEKCNGADPATRVKVPILEMKPDGVRVGLGATGTVFGKDECSGKPKYWPVTIDLPEPIGNRPVIDVINYPETKAEPPSEESGGVVDSGAHAAAVMASQKNAVRYTLDGMPPGYAARLERGASLVGVGARGESDQTDGRLADLLVHLGSLAPRR